MSEQKSILVVEDDDFLVRALQAKLKKEADWTVFMANDGEQGLETALSEKPNIIISDIMLPMMDGIQMVQKIRQNAWGAKVPVIFLTNVGFPGRSVEAQSLKADYLVKSSVHLDEILASIKLKTDASTTPSQ